MIEHRWNASHEAEPQSKDIGMDSGKSPLPERQEIPRFMAGRRLRFDAGVATLPAPKMTVPRSSWFDPTDDFPPAADDDDNRAE